MPLATVVETLGVSMEVTLNAIAREAAVSDAGASYGEPMKATPDLSCEVTAALFVEATAAWESRFLFLCQNKEGVWLGSSKMRVAGMCLVTFPASLAVSRQS